MKSRSRRPGRKFVRLFNIIFFILVMIIIFWPSSSLYVFHRLQEIGPDGVAKFLGHLVKSFKEGMDQ